MFNIKLVPKWFFGVDINRSVDPTEWILEGDHDSSLALRPSGQSERGEGSFGAV
jgi:hypothetical protein